MKTFVWAAILPLSLVSGLTLADEHGPQFGVDVTVEADDNQTRAERTRDQVEDVSAMLSASVAADWSPDPRYLLSVALVGEAQRFQDISELDTNSAMLRAAWRWQPTIGFTAPVFEINASTRVDDVKTDQRDSTVNRVQAFVTRKLTDRLTTSLGAEYRTRDSDGSVWDLIDRRWFLNLDLMLSQHDAGYFTFSRISGDTFSSAQRQFCNGSVPTDLLDLINGATEIEPDEAYNEALCGDWIAYRLDANTNVFTLGYNRGFGHTMSLDMSWTFVDVTGDEGNEYERNVLRATLLKRF